MNRLDWAVALVHHPVIDRRGDLVSTAVTNLDIHDIARAAKTYGARCYYLVTPLVEQQRLVVRLLEHWLTGYGAGYNPDRGEALKLVKVVSTLRAALVDFSSRCQQPALPLLTGANRPDGLSFEAGRELCEAHPVILTLGTGWGLASQMFACGWPVLEPIRGSENYNHLPVRAAAAIMFDRLFGPQIMTTKSS
jgi:hypothetical protein